MVLVYAKATNESYHPNMCSFLVGKVGGHIPKRTIVILVEFNFCSGMVIELKGTETPFHVFFLSLAFQAILRLLFSKEDDRSMLKSVFHDYFSD